MCNDGYEGTGLENDCSEILSVTNTFFPKEYNIQSIYPNPFNPIANLNFELPIDSKITIKVYNLQGQVISTLLNDYMQPGYHSVAWNADDNASGMYLIRMVAGDFTQTKKIILVK